MDEAYLKLLTALIEQTVKDLKDPITIGDVHFSSIHPTRQQKREAEWFVKRSPLFREIASVLDIDLNKARNGVLERVNTR